MRFTVVAVGKLKERFWKDACEEYLKRLQPYARTTVREVADIDPAKAGGVATARVKEGAAICGTLDSLGSSTHVMLLDIGGRERSSEELSRRLDELALRGSSDFAFVIGGSDGVSEEVRRRAVETLSFGPITLPHNLARVVLLEQLYRAQKISRGEPYHK
ncbi:23S rRNA (pseudouridine(1915)-N(3))-methyltransferase RlmH [uncultured Parolsenella sp.]|uniref:23S rRNA (pseudouridine(1915)-N(3))-methyltransferase RlmH n=1 Tax=uncultured Parolsenella sp. TaxID=2083008 RepID=UPI0025E197FE|nr:23S rRNA (pseudouridine(1915)-N(3))-methyltransferase RlmH [uncultured Parolsenella sp.]